MQAANFFIAGVPKAGTSSIHRWLADHPDVAGSCEKETYFFADPGTHMFRASATSTNGLDGYAQYFPQDGGLRRKVLVESTPAYIYYEEALRNIPELATRPKCLFVVREPAAQIYSLFRYFSGNWNWVPHDMSFRSFVEAAQTGSHDFNGNELARNVLRNAVYVDFLERWRARLGRERMFVRTFDHLLRDKKAFTRTIAGWLDLNPAFYDDYPFPRENDSYAVRCQRLQALNLRVRGKLRRARLYGPLRRAYRRLNTTTPPGPSNDDLEVMADLRRRFRADNERLARAFALDLSNWS